MLIEKERTYANTPGRLRARSGSKLPSARFRSGPGERGLRAREELLRRMFLRFSAGILSSVGYLSIIRSGPEGARGVFDSIGEFPTYLYLTFVLYLCRLSYVGYLLQFFPVFFLCRLPPVGFFPPLFIFSAGILSSVGYLFTRIYPIRRIL